MERVAWSVASEIESTCMRGPSVAARWTLALVIETLFSSQFRRFQLACLQLRLQCHIRFERRDSAWPWRLLTNRHPAQCIPMI